MGWIILFFLAWTTLSVATALLAGAVMRTLGSVPSPRTGEVAVDLGRAA